ncbi:MAG TPA: hypothetical protein VND88_06675 [Candidatus Acidoferrales bacterium]|nr:hypothetical protein [Candidatus Acidoferrales bacterium]
MRGPQPSQPGCCCLSAGGSAEPADGLPGAALLGLLAVSELADQVTCRVSKGNDVTQRWVVDGRGGRSEYIQTAKHGSDLTEQGGGLLDVGSGG